MPAPAAEAVIEMVSGTPAPPLRAFIGSYVGYSQERVAQRLHRGLPSRHLTIVLSLDRPLDIAAMPDPATTPGSFWALAGGLHAAPVMIQHDGNQHGVHIELTPLGTRALLGLPAGALASTVVDLTELLGRRAVELTDRLHAGRTWTEPPANRGIPRRRCQRPGACSWRAPAWSRSPPWPARWAGAAAT